MTAPTAAAYYDGTSSKAHPATVTLDLNAGVAVLCLNPDDDTQRTFWYAADISFEQYGSDLTILNRRAANAQLRVRDAEFERHFFAMMRRKRRVGTHQRLMHLGFRRHIMLGAGVMAALVLAYLFVLPPVAERAAAHLPAAVDDYLGTTAMANFWHDDSHEVDSARTAALNAFAARLNFGCERPLTFTVVRSPTVNAFAAPNGSIVVFTGLLRRLHSSAELAALLGHEAAHVRCRHATKSLCRSLAGYLLVSLAFTDVNGITTTLAENAQSLHNLAYSRAFEQEADEQGADIMLRNGLDPAGMEALFTRLEEADSSAIPTFLSTHPMTSARHHHIARRMAGTTFTPQGDAVRDSLFLVINE